MKLTGRLLSFAKIINDPLPPIEWVIEPIIPHHSRVVVYGEFGSKKSWLLLDLALHIAGGVPWMDQYAVPGARSVLYMDEEMSEYELRRRVKRLALGANLENKELPFRAISHLGMKFNETNVEQLLANLKTEGFDPDIVIVETLRRVLTGSENEAEDLSGFWQSVSPFLAAGKTLVLAHHMKKPNTNGKGRGAARNRASGSTDILAGAERARCDA